MSFVIGHDYEYVVDGKHPDDAVKFHSIWGPYSAETVAEEAAQHHHAHRGFERNWPIDIEIFLDGDNLGVFSVEREMTPSFVATKKA
ncbi:MAG: hypothetical protein Q8K86_08330 [Candidatus Nanopelagicaceae bacterium]|nr:hypothetical protein [Candidatus Nanopelagicaceae bacterium]